MKNAFLRPRATLLLVALALLVRLNGPVNAQTRPTIPGTTQRTATVGGVRLNYLTGGKGDLVVLLHGFPMTSYEWRKVAPALMARYTVLVPDLRGLGDSDKPAGGYDKKTLAEDIYGLVRQLGYDRFLLVGHDFGGSVAYALAAAHPEAVRRLVTMECMPAGLLPPDVTKQLVDSRFGSRGWFQSFHRVPNLPEELTAGRERAYLAYLFDSFLVNKQAVTPADLDEYVRTYAAPGTMHAAFEYYRAGPTDAADNQRSMRRKLPMPVLALGGDGSFGDATLQCLQAAATDVRGGVIKDCGHFVAEEQPEEVTRQLLAFFGEAAPLTTPAARNTRRK